mmetsp:Transcript_21429/g.59359  ORF Transcript_21429/g.59359 Transcript_21429/m.59359 type:complete len:236 (+) Transcript_21429:1743-2450(+)
MPPYTNARNPFSTKGANTCSRIGPTYSFTGDILTITTSSSAINLCSKSRNTTHIWLPAPSTSATPPLLAFPSLFSRYTLPWVAGFPGSSHTSPQLPGNRAFKGPLGKTSATSCPVDGRMVVGTLCSPLASMVVAYSCRPATQDIRASHSSPMPPPPAPFALVATLASSRACFKVLCMLALSIFARSGHSTAVQACLRASKRVRTVSSVGMGVGGIGVCGLGGVGACGLNLIALGT